MKILAWHVLEDTETDAEKVRASGLEWPLIRPPFVREGSKRGEYRHGRFTMKGRSEPSRADLGEFMARIAASGEHVGEAPFIVY